MSAAIDDADCDRFALALAEATSAIAGVKATR
jgi:hypothetical protein